MASVLVVEDHAGLRHALREGLTAYGFAVHEAADAAAAYALAPELTPDLVLLDWVLPGGDDGIEACRRLRALAPASRVVILTGLDVDDDDERSARDAGACTVLRKGLELEALAEELRALAGPGSPLAS